MGSLCEQGNSLHSHPAERTTSKPFFSTIKQNKLRKSNKERFENVSKAFIFIIHFTAESRTPSFESAVKRTSLHLTHPPIVHISIPPSIHRVSNEIQFKFECRTAGEEKKKQTFMCTGTFGLNNKHFINFLYID